MDFHFRSPYEGNEKPIMQHVNGGVLTEWRVDRTKDAVVRSSRALETRTVTPSAGTFFLGNMAVTRDELADYVLEMNERNAAKPKVDRLPDIQRKIADARQRHVDAIKAAVQWKARGYQLPKQPTRRKMKVPVAVGMVGDDGRIRIISGGLR